MRVTFDGDGLVGTVLDCELASVLSSIEDIEDTVAETAIVIWEFVGRTTDVQPQPLIQAFTAPDADLNNDGERDLETVLRSVEAIDFRSPNRGIRATEFTEVFLGIFFRATYFKNGLDAACNTLSATSAPDRTIVFISDGVNTIHRNIDLAIPCAEPVTIHTFAVGPDAGCELDPLGFGSLQDIADIGGGVCTDVAEPSDLSVLLGGVLQPRCCRPRG